MKAIVLATGPSAAPIDWGGFIVAVNDAYRLGKCSALYAADLAWWRVHADSTDGLSRKFTCDVYDPAERNELHSLGVEALPLDHGPCSGYGGIVLAARLGATRIGLVGFDMHFAAGKSHFFGDHPAQLRNLDNYHLFFSEFDTLAKRLAVTGVQVFNCTPDSRLTAFPQMPLEAFLNG